jgi:hypothetical protein
MCACSECRAEEKAMLFNIKRGNNEMASQQLPEDRFVPIRALLFSTLDVLYAVQMDISSINRLILIQHRCWRLVTVALRP